MVNPNTVDIRKFLIEFFSDEELTILCFDYFRDAYEEFAVGMAKGQKVQLLLERCVRREALPNLLAALRAERAAQYEARFGALAPAAEPRPAPRHPGRDPHQVFISHAHEDAEFAHRLAADLEAHGWRAWIAPDSILPGEKWAEAINRGLEASGVFVVALTPTAVRATWVVTETNVAIELEHKGLLQFIPAEIERCDVPLLWSAYQFISFRGNYEAGLAELIAQLGKGRGSAPRTETRRESEQPVRAGSEAPSEIASVAIDQGAPTEAPMPAPVSAPKRTSDKAVRRRVPSFFWVGLVAVGLLLAGIVFRPNAIRLLMHNLGISATQVSDKDGMVMAYVPAGEFTMGSADADPEAIADQKPQHKVYLDAFWIDRTEVTKAQYQRCVEAGVCAAQDCSGTGQGDHPVVCVTWDDAGKYCAWAGRRLPTEAEWEKAARGTDGRRYPWGNDNPDCGKLNYWSKVGGCVGNTTAVGSYPAFAAPSGALDMSGNVWEWVADWYDENYYATSPARNPQGPDSGNARLLRGGSWNNNQGDVRTAVRNGFSPGRKYDDVGFRCVRSP